MPRRFIPLAAVLALSAGAAPQAQPTTTQQQISRIRAENADLRRQIDAGGVEQTILASDLGQVGTYSPLEGMRRGIKMCMDLGYSDDDIRKMVSTNAARAMGFEADVAAARDGWRSEPAKT